MTAPRRDGEEEPWRKWIRQNPRLDSIRDGIALTDCDMWIHRYKVNTDRVSTREVQHLMLVEVKTFSADVPDSQRDTYQIINAILRTADRRTWSIPTRDGKPKRYVRS